MSGDSSLKTLQLPLSRHFIKWLFEAFQAVFSQKKKNIFGRVFKNLEGMFSGVHSFSNTWVTLGFLLVR